MSQLSWSTSTERWFGKISSRSAEKWRIAFSAHQVSIIVHPLIGSRILFLVRSGQLGGMELRLASIMRMLRSSGCQVEALFSTFDGVDSYLRELSICGVETGILDVPPFFEQWRWRRINRIRTRIATVPRVRRRKPDLVHVPFAWTDQGVSRLWVAAKSGLPTVVSVHNTFAPHEFSEKAKSIVREALRSTVGVYGNSESALASFQQIFGSLLPAEIDQRTIPNGVDIHRFCPSGECRSSTRAEWGVDESAPVIGCVGRLDAQKQPLKVLEAFASIKVSVPQAKLVFIGHGALREAIEMRANELGLGDSVLIAGFRSDPERVLPAIDIHLLVSKREGHSAATAEAMACGVPTVATDVGGVRDILHGTGAGILLKNDNVEEIAAEVSALLKDEARRVVMARVARQIAHETLSLNCWHTRLKEFYTSSLDKVRRRDSLGSSDGG